MVPPVPSFPLRILGVTSFLIALVGLFTIVDLRTRAHITGPGCASCTILNSAVNSVGNGPSYSATATHAATLLAQFSQQGPKLVGTGAEGTFAHQGQSVAFSADGNTAIVGGDLENNRVGAAWIWTRSGGIWIQQGPKLVASDAVGSEVHQGWSVALSGDGNTAIVGGWGDNSSAGAAWIWTRTGGVWTQQGPKLVGSGVVGSLQQGTSVSISGDGNTAIVGGNGAGWVWTRSGGVWTQEGSKLVGSAVGSAAQTGSVSISADGNTAIAGGWVSVNGVAAVAAWVWTRSGGVWTQQGSMLVGSGGQGGDQQTSSVALSADGNTAIIGGNADNGGKGAAWIWTRSGGAWTQQGPKLVASDAVGSQVHQGQSVSLSADGNTAIVGGDYDNGSVGAAWVWTRSGGVWTQQGAKLVGSGAVGNPFQGSSVAISADGNTAIVGGWGDNGGGAAWVWTRSGGVWTQQGSKLVGSDAVGTADQGYSVSISADGNTAIVGGPIDDAGGGAAWVWTRSGGVWIQQGSKLVGSGAVGAHQGQAVALSGDGNTAIVGGPFDNNSFGAAWIWTRSGGVWTQQGPKLVGTGSVGSQVQQGWSVSLSGDGNTAIIGVPSDNGGIGAAWVWTRSGGVWTQQGPKLASSDAVGAAHQGSSVSISADGNTAIVGGEGDNSNIGATWVWTRSGGVWTQQGPKLAGSGAVGAAHQGRSVSLSADGNTAIVGGFNDNGETGAAWIWTRSGGTWIQQGPKLVSSDAGLIYGQGFSVSISADGNTAIVGWPTDVIDDGSFGGAWVWTRSGGVWTRQETKLVGSGSVGSEQQGWSVSLSADGNTAIIGGPNDNGSVGAAWVFTTSPTTGLVQFSAKTYSQGENGGTATITVTRTGGSLGAASVQYSNPAGGTAAGGASCTSGVDYITPSGTLNWADADAASKTFAVTLCKDNIFEGSETVNLALSNATGATLGSQTTATLTVTDDDTPASQIQFSISNYLVPEASPDAIVTVTRGGETTAAATVNYATSDISGPSNCNTLGVFSISASARCDYLTTLGTLSFAAGETSKTITIPIVDDSYAEGTETFTITLSSPSGATLGSPATATVRIIDNDATNGTNPIDTSSFFVRQHYVDFLNREPDTSGLNFWTNQITSCGADAPCVEVKRINVSASFFLSIEFQDTGYLVERIHKTAYGDADGTSSLGGSLKVPIVRLSEFLVDTQKIGQGVVVLQPGWEQLLENNKNSFAAAFVQRSRFSSAFPTTLTPAQFVDKLFQNAGVNPSAADRNAAIAEFGSATNTSDLAGRGRALRRIAENGILRQQEFNRAFVLMQYFGYLRRDPNDFRDSDYTGYDFWLTKLNQFNGSYINAEMVKAFISSIEYRQRFGP